MIGDYEPDDAYDREPPDPEQVAYKLHRLREAVDLLAGGSLVSWDDLGTTERSTAFQQANGLVEWLRTHNPEPVGLAEAVHEARRQPGTTVPAWGALSGDEQALAIGLMSIVIDWLSRQGAIQ
jgi:hypothetical protein